MTHSNSITCIKRVHFCYGHRLVNHPGKCATLHGHNAFVEIHARRIAADTNELLDKDGMVVDFGILKSAIGGWIDEHWDHNTILSKDDTDTIELVSKCPGIKKPYILPYNPTAENLARYLLEEVCPKELAGHDTEVFKILFQETPSGHAEAAK